MKLSNSSGQYQSLAAADLTRGGVDVFSGIIEGPVALVYSDPPWNPGNEKWWRRYAGIEPPVAYDTLLDAWCACVVACRSEHVLVEQSVIAAHKQMLLDAVARCSGWVLPLLEEWVVRYGNPKRPNALLHFGYERITTDPGGMSGEAMTRAVFAGLNIQPGSTVADPCIGLGTTSRVAHAYSCNCLGTELNPARLEKAVAWLRKHGYAEVTP